MKIFADCCASIVTFSLFLTFRLFSNFILFGMQKKRQTNLAKPRFNIIENSTIVISRTTKRRRKKSTVSFDCDFHIIAFAALAVSFPLIMFFRVILCWFRPFFSPKIFTFWQVFFSHEFKQPKHTHLYNPFYAFKMGSSERSTYYDILTRIISFWKKNYMSIKTNRIGFESVRLWCMQCIAPNAVISAASMSSILLLLSLLLYILLFIFDALSFYTPFDNNKKTHSKIEDTFHFVYGASSIV